MPLSKLTAVHCTLSRGGFSSERVFRIRLADGGEHIGAAPLQYCYGPHDRRLGPNEPAPNTPMKGKVAARIVREEDEERVLISVPDGEVIVVARGQLTSVKGASPDVPVQS